MKSEIHPEYYKEAKVTCACGHTFTVGATLPEFKVEICSNCHPFYTGKQKLIDSGGQLEKFRQRLARVKTAKAATSKKKRF